MKTYVKGKKDNSKLIMRIGDYVFPVENNASIESNCGFDSLNLFAPVVRLSALFKSKQYAEKIENVIKSEKYKSIDFCVNDDTTITGEIVDCYSHLKHLYIYVRFVLDE